MLQEPLWPDDFFPLRPKDTVIAALREASCERVEVHGCEGGRTVTSRAEVMKESGPSISRFPGYETLNDAEREEFAQSFTTAVSRCIQPDGVARIETRAIIGIGHLAKR